MKSITVKNFFIDIKYNDFVIMLIRHSLLPLITGDNDELIADIGVALDEIVGISAMFVFQQFVPKAFHCRLQFPRKLGVCASDVVVHLSQQIRGENEPNKQNEQANKRTNKQFFSWPLQNVFLETNICARQIFNCILFSFFFFFHLLSLTYMTFSQKFNF